MALKLNKQKNAFLGVCAGLADATGWDVRFIRAAFALAFVCWGTGLGLYFILWLIMALNTD